MGDEGVHACPSGYEPITDVNICEEAANYIDIVFDGTVLISKLILHDTISFNCKCSQNILF